ncbi:MAG: hypothetical protein KOO69_07355 [Victivallales bacterium]|nr:hypothetical protein [Victivallales bacterium]
MKNLRIAALLFSLIFVLIGSGCMSDGDPANIGLSILQKKMHKAMDPDGLYRKSKSYVQKQMMVVSEGWSADKGYIVETKYKRPDKMSIIFKEDNIPIASIIFNGDNVWSVNYKEKQRTLIKGEQLEKLKVLFALGRPGSTYQEIFKDVKLFETELSGNPYYKIKCISKFEDQDPLYIYVGRHNFLTKRIETSSTTSIVDRYGLHDGVIIPEQTHEFVNGSEKRYKLIVYKLNVKIDDNEFFPPAF